MIIRHQDTGATIYECDAATMRECVERAVKEKADLTDASLQSANLEGADLEGANLDYANLEGANLDYANLEGANLRSAILEGANLEGANLPDLGVDRRALRLRVADHIEAHPELHDQVEWGDGSADEACGTPCCVAGWACHLGGGDRGLSVSTAATLLLHVDGLPTPNFDANATREEILAALRSGT
jgi:hypothetical protein